MKDLAAGLWQRANKALTVARAVLSLDPDTAASRAYFAALYAVSAHFALEGRTFKKHSAIEAAVHRDLVKAGIWASELGEKYSMLAEMRGTGDYGTLDHVSDGEARNAVQAADDILRAVARADPREFTSSEAPT
jgi:uncharacterized protein (UPF0332 family)